MTIDGEAIKRLETAATRGDARAAVRLGQLLSLTAGSTPDDQTWPEERWLRAAVERNPEDVEALSLLAGRLTQQALHWDDCLDLNPEYAQASGESAETVERRRDEARDLYERIRAAGPGGDAEAGLDELAYLLELRDEPAADAYSFYLFEDEAGSGSVAHIATIVTTDADDMRWACDEWLELSEGGLGVFFLFTYVDGVEVASIELPGDDAVDWNAVTVPELTGVRLPPGLPVPGRELSYGFAARVE